ncbi:hypothetical protein ABGB18_07995 [Nonomuraea sp. B12E4]|uniref:hypothetical protein n=1 Tax=Nonomuraea sp. B12E4 TaxID=3153564 RepID=UPI00325F1ED7
MTKFRALRRSVSRYLDGDAHDGNGADVAGLGTVDDGGWTQAPLPTQPATVTAG